MAAQLSLFAPAPGPTAGEPLPLFTAPVPTPQTPWALTLKVYRTQNYAVLSCDKSPSDFPILRDAAQSVGLPVHESGILIAPIGYTPLGDIGGEFLKHLARQHPERELQIWRTTVTDTEPSAKANPEPAPTPPSLPPTQLDPRPLTAPRSSGRSTNRSTNRSAPANPAPQTAPPPEPPSKLAALAQTNPGRILVVRPAPAPAEPYAPPITRAAKYTWPVNFTVYADGQTVISVADWELELFRQVAARHNYATDGDAVVMPVRRVDEQLPWEESNVRLDDQATAFIDDLPYTELRWHFHLRDLPLPEQYTAATTGETDETNVDDPVAADHIYVIDLEPTRAELLADGELVDVTDIAREAGFLIPVAVTRALWAVIEDIPLEHAYQSVNGRLWDLVFMGHLAARKNPEASVVHFELIMHHQNRTYLDVTLRIGADDTGKPVMTFMLADEE